MATTQFNNRLITPELTEALSSYPLYSQVASLLDCKRRSTATSLQPKWQVSPMMQASTDLAL